MNKYDKTLQRFVGGGGVLTEHPFAVGDYICGTDTHIAVRIDKSLCEGEYMENKIDLDRVFQCCEKTKKEISLDTLKELLKSIPRVETLTKVQCEECGGEGEVEWVYEATDGERYTEDHDCPVCNGRGYHDTEVYRIDRVISINGIGFRAEYIMLLAEAMSDLGVDIAEIYSIQPMRQMLLHLADGVGVAIMPFREARYPQKPAVSITL